MIIKHILKDRESWLKHRQKYIGGSDASAILGMNPWKSNVQLWLEKTGMAESEDISDKACVKFGNDAEPVIRQLSRLNYPEYEFFYEENNSFINDKFPFMAASLDGWLMEKKTKRRGIHEIKTSEIVSSMQKEKWNKQIPPNYYCQLLHYFAVRTDCQFALLTALLTWRVNDSEVYQQVKNYHIERSDVEDDIQYLIEKETEFYESIKSGNQPSLILPDI